LLGAILWHPPSRPPHISTKHLKRSATQKSSTNHQFDSYISYPHHLSCFFEANDELINNLANSLQFTAATATFEAGRLVGIVEVSLHLGKPAEKLEL